MPVVLTIRWPCTVTADAPPFHIALTTAWMSCWWTTSRLRSSVEELMTSSGASESVTITPGPVTGVEPGRAARARSPRLLEPAYVLVLDLVGQLVDLGVQVGHPVLEVLHLAGLVGDQRGEVGVAARAQVGAVAVDGADHEQGAAQAERHRGGQPPGPGAPGSAAGGVRPRARIGSRRHAD